MALQRHGLMRQDQNYVHPIEDGYGLVRNDVTLQACITAIGSATKTMMLTPGEWAIANDLTIPANITFYRCQGATINVLAGKTFRVLGQMLDDGGLVASGITPWASGPPSAALAVETFRPHELLPTGVLDGAVAHVTNSVKGLWFKHQGAWFPIGGMVYRPELFPGADIGAKIQAAHDAMPATGGVIDCRAFEGEHFWHTTVTLSKSTRLLFNQATFPVDASPAISVIGTANLDIQGLSMWGTLFIALTSGLRVIDFTSNGHLYATNLFAHSNGVPQTSGYLISLKPAQGSAQHEISRCTADSLFEVVVIGSANLVNIKNCDFVNAVNAEIHGTYFGAVAFDAGTTYVTDCTLVSNHVSSSYGIVWDDSSGLYVHNCHILGHAIGVAAFATQPHIYNEIMIYDNRIGQQGVASVVIERASGTGGFAQCIISNNNFGSVHPTYVSAIQLGFPGGPLDIHFSSVVNNRITCQHTSPCTLLSINSGNDIYVAGNDFISAGPANAAIGIGLVFPREIRIGRNKYTGFTPHATVTTPPTAGVVYEPEVKTGLVNVDLASIAANTQAALDVVISGLRPNHGDQISFERNGSLPASLVFGGSIISADDTARLFIYNISGGAIDVGPDFWNYTWIDMVP